MDAQNSLFSLKLAEGCGGLYMWPDKENINKRINTS
jgi:hypothetical protein